MSLALQHAKANSDLKDICTLLQVCKSWRAVVQQSSTNNLEIVLKYHRFEDNQLAHLHKLAGFASWLPKCSGLVKAIKWEFHHIGDQESSSPDDWAPVSAAASSLMELALQLAAVGPISKQRSAPPLRLSSFGSEGLINPALISALPAGTLTSLSIGLPSDSSNILAALSRLTNLRQLELDNAPECLYRSDFSLPDLRGLSGLTQLMVNQLANDNNFKLLPMQLKALSVDYAWQAEDTLVDLSHMQQLQDLYINCHGVANGSTIPLQLPSLSIQCGSGNQKSMIALLGINQLKQLSALHLVRSNDSAKQLMQVATLPQLQEMSLAYWDSTVIVHSSVSAAWRHVRQLNDLDLRVDVTVQNAQHIFRDIGFVTQLTRLVLEVDVIHVEEAQLGDDHPPVLVTCACITGLTNLQKLRLGFGPRANFKHSLHDTMHLTALRGLRELALKDEAPVVDDAVIICLAAELTNLERLEFGEDIVSYPTCGVASLHAIGKLTKLVHLVFGMFLSEEDARMGLSCLAALSALTGLGGFIVAGEGALAEFWDVVRPTDQLPLEGMRL